MSITDDYLAYIIDSAVWSFGSALEGELEGVDGKNKKEIKAKRERVMTKWLDLPQKYRNPGMVGPGNSIDQQRSQMGESR